MIARNSRTAAPVSQTCQCEKRPTLMGKSPVDLRSVLSLQNAKTIAITAPGVRSAANPNARCLFLRWFRRTLGPLLSRIRTIISCKILVYQAHYLVSTGANHLLRISSSSYGKTKDCNHRHWLHGKSSRRERPAARLCRNRGRRCIERRESPSVRPKPRSRADHGGLQNLTPGLRYQSGPCIDSQRHAPSDV